MSALGHGASIPAPAPTLNDRASNFLARNATIAYPFTMDALSDLLHVVQLTGAVYLDGAFSAPWCVIGSSDSALCAAYLPPSERVLSFHLVTEGRCWAMLPHDRASALLVEAGDVIVVPQGETHLLGSSTDLSPELMAPLLAKQVETTPGEVMTLAYGGDGAVTRMICGFLAAQDIGRNPLLSALPRLFKVAVRGSSASWLEPSMRFAAEEAASAHAGSAAVLAKLAELVFVQAVRNYVDAMPDDRKGWLAGLRDRFVARALAHHACTPDAAVDRGRAGPSRWIVAFRVRATIHRPAWGATDAIPGAVALAAGRAATSPLRSAARVDRGGRWLRI